MKEEKKHLKKELGVGERRKENKLNERKKLKERGKI